MDVVQYQNLIETIEGLEGIDFDNLNLSMIGVNQKLEELIQIFQSVLHSSSEGEGKDSIDVYVTGAAVSPAEE